MRDRQLGQLAVQLAHPARPAARSGRRWPPARPAGRRRRSAQAQHLVDRRPVLAGQPGQRRPPLGDLLQPSRLGLQVAEVAGQVTRDIGQPVAELGQPAAERGQHVVLGPVLQRLAGGGDLAQRAAGLVIAAGHPGQRRRTRPAAGRRPTAAGAPRRPGRRPRRPRGSTCSISLSPNRSRSTSRARACAADRSRSSSAAAARRSAYRGAVAGQHRRDRVSPANRSSSSRWRSARYPAGSARTGRGW